MEIYLYRYTGRYNKINKSSGFGDTIHIREGEFRDAVNIINPQIMFVYPDNSITLLQMNYVYIPSMGRYYFITNCELTRKNLVTLTLHVDVLYSHINVLKDLSHGYIARNEYNYNALLPDERRIIKNIPIQSVTRLNNVTSGSMVNVEFNYNLSSYSNITISYVDNSVTKAEYKDLATGYVRSALFYDERVMNYYDMNTAIVSMLSVTKLSYALSEIKDNSTLAGFVGNITVYPFKITDIVSSSDYATRNFLIGNELINDENGNAVTVSQLKHSLSKEIIIKDFILNDNITVSDFNDLNPYCKYELYIPFYGYYELNFNALRGHRLIVYYLTNFKNGNSTVYLCDYTDTTKRNIIFSAPVQLGVKLGTTVENTKQVNDAKTQNNFNTSMSLISTILSGLIAGAGVVTGNPLLMAGGLAGTTLGVAKTLGQHDINEMKNYAQGNIQFGGDSTMILSPFDVYLRVTRYEVQYSLNSDFLHENGGVSNTYVSSLTSIYGYTEFADLEIQLINSAGTTYLAPTTEEVKEFIDLCKKGVYFDAQP